MKSSLLRASMHPDTDVRSNALSRTGLSRTRSRRALSAGTRFTALLVAGCFASALTFPSAALAAPKDRVAPTATITSPVTGTQYTSAQSITILATATDAFGVTRVDFHDNGVLRATSTTPPYRTVWTVAAGNNGSHSWTARAYDAAGNVGVSAPVALTVKIASTDTQRPLVSIVSPPTGTLYTTAQTVTISASASDNVGVTKVEFYDGATLRCAGTARTCAWSVTSAANGSHAWSARAYDAAGNVATSAAVTLNVSIASGDTQAPAIAIVSPPTGTTYTSPQTVSISASASDNVGISRIEFFDGATLKCAGTAPSCPWTIGSASNGTHTWTARAYDAAGNSRLSAPVTLTINIATTAHGAPLWTVAFGGDSAADVAVGRKVAFEPGGDVFVAATLAGSGDFNPASPVFSPNSTGNVVLARYSSTGIVEWTRIWNGSTTQAIPTALRVDGSGNVVMAGYFQGTVDFGGGPLTSTGGYSAFLVKYRGDGGYIWSRRMGGTGSVVPSGVALDSLANVYVTGYLQGGGDFGGGAVTSNTGSRDVFLAKYGATGAYAWSRTFGGPLTDAATGIAITPAGDPVITGSFQGTADFGSGLLTSAGGDDVFLARYSALGVPLWSRAYGGIGLDQAAGVGVDGAGSIVVALRFQGTSSFGGTALTSAGDMDIALASYSINGLHQWSKRWGGLYVDQVQSVAVSTAGEIAITGVTLSAIDLGGGYLWDTGSFDVFVAKYSASGAHVWSKRAGKLYDDRGNDVAIDATGGVVVTGLFMQGINFGNGELLNAGGSDGFVGRFAP